MVAKDIAGYVRMIQKLAALCPDGVLSAHIIASSTTQLKKGLPGRWTLIQGEILDKQTIQTLVEEIKRHPDALVETNSDHYQVLQVQQFRIMYLCPPLSKLTELTIVRMHYQKELQTYTLYEHVKSRLTAGRGVLVAGAPGHGKSTFVSALIRRFAKDAVVKTIESPRDLMVPPNVTQIAYQKDTDQLRDILLLSRPDVVCIDEIRHKQDAKLFADLRLCGIGCFGVIHATTPVDAVARFLNNVGIGSLAHTLDTVIFIKDGDVHQLLDISLQVKVPIGMKSKDLARPVVQVRDVLSSELLYEVFSYADQVIIHEATQEEEGVDLRAVCTQQFLQLNDIDAKVTLENNAVHIHVDKEMAEKVQPLLTQIEQMTNSGVQVRVAVQMRRVSFAPVMTQNSIGLRLEVQDECAVYIDGRYVLCGRPAKNGLMRIRAESEQARELVTALRTGQKIEVFAR